MMKRDNDAVMKLFTKSECHFIEVNDQRHPNFTHPSFSPISPTIRRKKYTL